MDIFREFKKAGLVKSKMGEDFYSKDEVTTSANTGAAMKPVGGELDKTDDQEEMYHGEGDHNEEACEKIKECVERMMEAYETLSGKKLGELFCPACSKDDMKDAPTHDGNQSAIDNEPNYSKNRGGEE